MEDNQSVLPIALSEEVQDKLQVLHNKLVAQLETAIDIAELGDIPIDRLVRAYAQMVEAQARLIVATKQDVVIRVEYEDLSVAVDDFSTTENE